MAGYGKQAGEASRCVMCDDIIIWANDARTGELAALDRDPSESGDCHFLDDETYESVSPERADELRSSGIFLRFRHNVGCTSRKIQP